MKAPSTLSFVLAHYGFAFVAGIAMTVVGVFQFFTFEPDPPSLSALGVASAASMFGQPVYALGALVGLFCIVWAWVKAANLRNGKRI